MSNTAGLSCKTQPRHYRGLQFPLPIYVNEKTKGGGEGGGGGGGGGALNLCMLSAKQIAKQRSDKS